MQTVGVRLLWHPQAQFAGVLLAAHENMGVERGVRLVPTAPGDMKPIEAVRQGREPFGVASPAHMLASGDTELRLLLTLQQTSPLVYVVHPDSDIEKPEQFAGRKVGVWPGGEDLEFRWLLHKAGVPVSQVELIELPDVMPKFLAGELDAAQMTTYNELLQLRRHPLGGKVKKMFRAADFGASVLKDGLFTTKSFIRESPHIVQAVVDTVLQGWVEAARRPADAVAACLAAWPGLDRELQAEQLEDILSLTFTGATEIYGLGYPDPKHVRTASEALRDTRAASRSPAVDPEEWLDMDFWEQAPSAYRVKRWPS